MSDRFRRRCRLALVLFVLVFAVLAVSSDTGIALAANEALAPKLQIPIPNVQLSKFETSGDYISVPWIAQYVSGFYRFAAGVGTVIVGVMFVVGGFEYLTAGTSGRAGSGKQRITDASIGLILILGAYVILATVNPALIEPAAINVFKVKQAALPPAEEKQRVIESATVPVVTTGGEPGASGATGGPTTPPPPGAPGSSKAGVGSGCGSSGRYPNLPPQSPCSGADACENLFCVQKNYTPPKGVPTEAQVVGFDKYNFPETIGEQARTKGITMLSTTQACYTKKGCDTEKFFSIVTYGPKASAGLKALMKGGRSFLPEVVEGLIKAGEAAKAEGYFIGIGDGFRTMTTQATAWCQRREAFKLQGKPGSGGVATPGTSNHQFALAVDVALFKLDGNRYYQLTGMGGVCQQVEFQKALGPEHLVKLEQFMSAGGLKHMCEEVWHFDFSGIYGIDCTSCEFPGKMATRAQKECGGKK